MRTGNRHLFRLIAMAFVALAAAVPAAQAAGSSPDDRAVSRSTSAALAPATISPDDRGYYRGASATSVSPDDRAFARSVPGIEPRTIPVMVVTPQGGFDWTDAIVGATLGLGLALLGAGAVLIGVRHRSSLKTA
jgi:hypothetical protein